MIILFSLVNQPLSMFANTQIFPERIPWLGSNGMSARQQSVASFLIISQMFVLVILGQSSSQTGKLEP